MCFDIIDAVNRLEIDRLLDEIARLLDQSGVWHRASRKHGLNLSEVVGFAETFVSKRAKILDARPRLPRGASSLGQRLRDARAAIEDATQACGGAPWLAVPSVSALTREAVVDSPNQTEEDFPTAVASLPAVVVVGDLPALIAAWAKQLDHQAADLRAARGLTPRQRRAISALQIVFRWKWFMFASKRAGRELDDLGALLFAQVFGTRARKNPAEAFGTRRRADARKFPDMYRYARVIKGRAVGMQRLEAIASQIRVGLVNGETADGLRPPDAPQS